MRRAVALLVVCFACGGSPRGTPPEPRPDPTEPEAPATAAGSTTATPRPHEERSAPEPTAAPARTSGIETEAPPAPEGDPLPPPRMHLGLGGAFSCAVDGDARVWCWGDNRFGQLGDPSLEVGARSVRPTPLPVALVRARRIAVGIWHVCALRPDGRVACWGHNGWGQLGDGTREDRPRPVEVAGLEDVVEIATGLGHSCARTASRELYCWGQNEHGQLGDGSYELRRTPTRVDLDDVASVVAGRAHTCALKIDGRVWCWGENLDGQLGDDTRSEPAGHRPTPAPVSLDEGAVELAAGPGATCARTAARILCWGRNDSMQLAPRGGGRVDAALLAPTPMPGATPDARVALGSRFSCVRDDGGGVRCVGLNHRGQLGDGTRRLRRRLTPIDGLLADDLALGVEHACALQGAEVWCWGDNRAGQLGRDAPRLATTPTLVFSLGRSPAAETEAPQPGSERAPGPSSGFSSQVRRSGTP